MPGGYMKKLLFIDLSTKKIGIEEPSDELQQTFLGGYGLGANILYRKQKGGVDPLGEKNILGILAGPLTGTPLPFVSRFTVVGKSPLTNCWGDANGSGFFGPGLKFSGFDGIFFESISEKPIYLLINNGQIKICDASFIWGKDTYETEDILKNKYGKNAVIACMGPSGEKLSKIAGVVTAKGRIAARSGLGAVMGSKKIKAVVCIGNKKVPLQNAEEVEYLRKKYTKQMHDGVGFSRAYHTTGTIGHLEGGSLTGDSPIKNWKGTINNFLNDINEYNYDNVEKYIIKRKTCYKCPMADWGSVMVNNGEFALKEESHIPEYESSSAFGSYCLNTNFESIIKCNDLCNRYGIDTISTGAIVAFAINCFEEGIISIKDTDGIELTWGNSSSIVKMTEKIGKREGFGDILADGVKEASEKIGKGSEKFAIHVGGQELPAHDPRYEPTMASIYKNNATPGRHTQDAQYCVPPKLIDLLPDVDFSLRFGKNNKVQTGRAKAQKVISSLNHCANSIGMCLFGFLSTEVTFMPECYSAVSGNDFNLEEFLTIGERIGDMRLAFTLREGVNPMNFNFPKIALGDPPLRDGLTKDVTVDLDLITEEFYKEMDWDLKKCIPSKNKLKELGLEWLIDDLWK